MSYLLREPITQQAMKDTGLTLEQMMAVRLSVPDSDPSNRGGWTISGFSDPAHIPALVDFAILRWFYSSESNEPGNEEWKQAASTFVHSASRGTYADDGSAVQKGRRKERRPHITEWISKRLNRKPDAKSPELWADAPEWLTDEIGYDRFSKRVTKARKELKSRK